MNASAKYHSFLAIERGTNTFEAALESGDAAAAGEAYRQISGVLDRAAGKGVIPSQRADRKKGRMAKRLASI